MPLVPSSSRGAGGLARLSSTTLAAPGTFNIALADQTYSDILLVMIVRGTRAATADLLNMTVNSDGTAAHYDWADTATQTTGVASTSGLGTGAFWVVSQFFPANTASANTFGVVECWLHNYADTTKNKTFISLSWCDQTSNTAFHADTQMGSWLQTTAITSVQIAGQVTANLATGSQVRVYGRQ